MMDIAQCKDGKKNCGEEGDSKGSDVPEELFGMGWEVEVPTHAVQHSEDRRSEYQDNEEQSARVA